jgi:hypothetical protein
LPRNSVDFVIQVGYPKTATTTFQRHVFPEHHGIFYVGKLIPSFGYIREGLYELVEDLLTSSTLEWQGPKRLQDEFVRLREQANGRTMLLSSEAFVHPYAIDIGLVADRLAKAAGPCRILITIREQISAILSWYWMHGRYGQYLTIGGKYEDDALEYPLSFATWLKLQRSAVTRNFISTLHYDRVVECYQRVFGAENVRVLLFEELRADRDRYFESLADWLKIDCGSLRHLADGDNENVSLGRKSSWSARDAETLLAQDVRPDVSTLLEELKSMYRPGNTRLAERVGLNLDRYEYPILSQRDRAKSTEWKAYIKTLPKHPAYLPDDRNQMRGTKARRRLQLLDYATQKMERLLRR